VHDSISDLMLEGLDMIHLPWRVEPSEAHAPPSGTASQVEQGIAEVRRCLLFIPADECHCCLVAELAEDVSTEAK
jgi:hypothetical protein